MTRPILLALFLIVAGGARAEEPSGTTTDPTKVRAGAYVLDAAHGKITWSVSHLGYSTYYGQISDVAGRADLDPKDPARSRLAVTIGMASINGLHDKLNGNLRGPDFFDTDRYPQATFAGTTVEPTGPTTARITGALTLKGVTKPVSFDATFNQAGIHPIDQRYTVGFDGRAVLKRSDFGITAFLPAVGDEVTLRLEGEFKLEEKVP